MNLPAGWDEKRVKFVLDKNLKATEKEPRTLELIRKILKVGGFMVLVGPNPDPDTVLLLEWGRSIDPTNKRFTHETMKHNQCHWNVAELWGKGTLDAIYTGYALGSDELWRQHSLGWRNGKFVETTQAEKPKALFMAKLEEDVATNWAHDI